MKCGKLRTPGSVAIVGAGPGGAMLARLLQIRGCNVRVFERDESATARPQGGSLDLRADSGQRAVGAAGLTAEFAAFSREDAKVFRMLDAQGAEMPGVGTETHEDPGPEVDRADLRRLLLDALAPDTVLWGHAVLGVHPTESGQWRLDFQDRPSLTADLVVGADGMGSKVRGRLTSAEPVYTGITMLAANIRREHWRGSALSDVLGAGSVMFADGRRTVFVQRCAHDLILLYYSLAVPRGWPENEPFGLDDTAAVLAAVRDSFSDWSPEVMDMLTGVQDGFHLWPTSVMPPDARWPSQPGLTMLGDAAHAMPPFTGKGVNLALLDALELADGLTADPERDVSEAIAAFEAGMQARAGREPPACLAGGRPTDGVALDFDTPLAA